MCLTQWCFCNTFFFQIQLEFLHYFLLRLLSSGTLNVSMPFLVFPNLALFFPICFVICFILSSSRCRWENYLILIKHNTFPGLQWFLNIRISSNWNIFSWFLIQWITTSRSFLPTVCNDSDTCRSSFLVSSPKPFTWMWKPCFYYLKPSATSLRYW